ncbi:DUF6882 domain-containing protein [Streptomyces sp. TLI_053]|uniref:DUF6882 domain-containing protein n=1 Tax=Streptomyces sp. TLI_053 TaxID=1855352 RepID=UPI00336BE1F9
MARRGQRVYSLTRPLAHDSRTFTGTDRTWRWPWAETLGPTPAVAAAARLRRWAHDRAADDADLSELAQQVIGCGTSIALVAITVEVLTLHAGRLDGELDALLGQPDLWELPPSPAAPSPAPTRSLGPREPQQPSSMHLPDPGSGADPPRQRDNSDVVTSTAFEESSTRCCGS